MEAPESQNTYGLAINPDINLRELLRLSQSDFTKDPELGLQHAVEAYLEACKPKYSTTDPTAAGEAAAKAGFRAEQAGASIDGVTSWFECSYEALAGKDERTKRELVATHLLEGRSLALRLVRKALDDPKTAERASNTFTSGENILKEQHERGRMWDPYGTMLARHRATHEAMNGSTKLAARVASQGVWRAIRAKQETANSPSGILMHGKFIVKQAINNAAAGTLAITNPLRRAPVVGELRRKLALSLLG